MHRLTCLSPRIGEAFRRNFANDANSKPKVPETYYDVLKVSSNCSTQDIRNAFVRLSKQYHPDSKNCSANTAAFVKISEAYKTLVKPQTRKEYDRNLQWLDVVGSTDVNVTELHKNGEIFRPWEVKPDYNTNPGPYYGIKGLNRVSNWQVALFLVSVGILGAIFGFSSVKHSFQLSRQMQDEISAEAISHHAAVVANAKKFGNEEQIRRMVERMAKDPWHNEAASK